MFVKDEGGEDSEDSEDDEDFEPGWHAGTVVKVLAYGYVLVKLDDADDDDELEVVEIVAEVRVPNRDFRVFSRPERACC